MSTLLLVDVVVGVGVGSGIGEGVGVGTGLVVGVVGTVTTAVVGVLDSWMVDDGMASRSDSKVSSKGRGTGGVLNVLVADCVPLVTICRFTCFRRYLGRSAPPCPAGAAAAAGLSVASTAREAAKTIDDLRTIAEVEYVILSILLDMGGRLKISSSNLLLALVSFEPNFVSHRNLLSGLMINE